MNQKIAGVIIGTLVLMGGSFYEGMRYATNTASTQSPRAGGFSGTRGAGRTGNGGFITGEVLSKDAQGITVKMRDGGSSIVFIGKTATVSKSATGSVDDIAVGTQVMVTGSKNTDGSINAQSVQIRPELPKITQ